MKTADAVPLFAVTGSPCGAKSKVIDAAVGLLKHWGFGILMVPEVTLPPDLDTIASCKESLEGLLKTAFFGAIERECRCHVLDLRMGVRPAAIITSQGCFDACAYAGSAAFLQAVKLSGYSADKLLQRYAAAIHLVYELPESYRAGHNSALDERTELSMLNDTKLHHAWEAHPFRSSIPTLCLDEARRFSLKEKTEQFVQAITLPLDIWPSCSSQPASREPAFYL